MKGLDAGLHWNAQTPELVICSVDIDAAPTQGHRRLTGFENSVFKEYGGLLLHQA